MTNLKRILRGCFFSIFIFCSVGIITPSYISYAHDVQDDSPIKVVYTYTYKTYEDGTFEITPIYDDGYGANTRITFVVPSEIDNAEITKLVIAGITDSSGKRVMVDRLNYDFSACTRIKALSLDVNNSYFDFSSLPNGIKSISIGFYDSSDCDIVIPTLPESITEMHIRTNYNNFNIIDLQNCKGIKTLEISETEANKLILRDLRHLEEVKFNITEDENKFDSCIKRLDVSGCNNLKLISVKGLEMEKISLTGCTSLQYLDCGPATLPNGNFRINMLKSLDVTSCPNLKELICARNLINILDLSKCRKLEKVNCTGNVLCKLDVSKNTNLKHLYCRDNRIKQLNLYNCRKLVAVNCSENYITKLDLTKNKRIKKLYCQYNCIQTLKLASYKGVEGICRYNLLKKKDALKMAKYFGRANARSQSKFSKDSIIVYRVAAKPVDTTSVKVTCSIGGHINNCQIQIREKGSKKWQTYKCGLEGEKIIKRLQSGKRYQVRVRGRFKYFGKWYNGKWIYGKNVII